MTYSKSKSRKKLIAAIAILLMCIIMVAAVSYAWLTMSSAPEVLGINTHIGANGSLEIALANDKTYLDPSSITSIIGSGSADQSNNHWGNVISLSNSVALRPSRLNAFANESGKAVIGANMLAVPSYSPDGRFESIHSNTVSGTFKDTGFVYSNQTQGYGVRAIGTIPAITLQESSLANARSAVRAYTNSSNTHITALWTTNGAKLISIYIDHYKYSQNSFDSEDIAIIKDTLIRLDNTITYTDLALRQGIVGYMASETVDESSFRTIKSTVENTSIALSSILPSAPVDLPDDIIEWVSQIDQYKEGLNLAVRYCDYLKGDNISWEQISPLLTYIMDENQVYLENTALSKITPQTPLRTDNVLTISTKAGIMSAIADLSGNFEAFFDYADNVLFEVGSVSTVQPPYLTALADELDSYTAATDKGGVITSPLDAIYGYALDMVLRCNQTTDLLLQTAPAATSNLEPNGALESGSGSYMSFDTSYLTLDQILEFMDAVRIGFADNQGTLLGIAKLSVSEYSVIDGDIAAPIYMYDYTINADDGSISMGERRSNSAICQLQKNFPTIITTLIWLDGDYVGNDVVSALQENLSGSLNIQFTSSAELTPAP